VEDGGQAALSTRFAWDSVASPRRTILVVLMNSDQKSQMRRKSMYGTALFALGIVVAVASVLTGSV
jgi:hypothetical protein